MKRDRQLMTVDGKRLQESDVDLSKLDSKKFNPRLDYGINGQQFEVKIDQVANAATSLKQVTLNNNGVIKAPRELMTVDGRKLEESDVDLSRLDSRKVNRLDSGITNGHQVYPNEKLGNWTPYVQALPNFEMKPFWNSMAEKFEQRSELGIQNDSDFLKILVDVKHFLPEEVNVRCTENHLIVEANHESKEDPFGFISRQYSRKFELPKGIKVEEIKSNLGSNGLLQIKAPKPKPKIKSVYGYQDPGVKIPIVMNGAIQLPQRPKASNLSEGYKESRIYVPPTALAKPAQKEQAMTNGNPPNDQYANENSIRNIEISDAGADRTIIPFGAVTAY